MKPILLKFSKTKIDKAGESLKTSSALGNDSNEALEILSGWRAFHAVPLNIFATALRERIKKTCKTSGWIVAQRLKRTPSIVLKLKTHKTMRLSTMQDIGGVRAVLNTVQEVYDLVHVYRTSRTSHKLFALHDYIATPKEDGYRSVHLIYQVNKTPNIFIEIQVRSYLQHIWATAVEVFGTLKSTSFKSGYGEKRWLELFAYLSTIFSIKEGTPVLKDHSILSREQVSGRLKRMIKDMKAIEQLSVYTAIYKITAQETRSKGKSGGYSIIVLDSTKNTISIQTFGAEKIEEATSAYIDLEKKFYDDTNINVVLVNAGDVKKLEASYPNYFMDTRILIRYLSQIMLDEF
jgi:hypothetical protein